MKTCTTLLLLSITFLVGLTHADVNKERELQDILRKHADAMGGLRNWNKVESIRTTGTIERDGQLVDFCIIKKRPNQIRATITMPIPGKEDEHLQIIRAHDGRDAWTSTRLAGGETLAYQPLSGDEATDLVDEAQVLPQLIHLWQNNANLEIIGLKTFHGKMHHIIKATHKDSPNKSYEFYLSDDSKLVSKQITYKKGAVASTTILSDSTPVSGITIPKTRELDSTATGTSVIEIHDVTVGVGIYEEYFESNSTTETVALAKQPEA